MFIERPKKNVAKITEISDEELIALLTPANTGAKHTTYEIVNGKTGVKHKNERSAHKKAKLLHEVTITVKTKSQEV